MQLPAAATLHKDVSLSLTSGPLSAGPMRGPLSARTVDSIGEVDEDEYLLSPSPFSSPALVVREDSSIVAKELLEMDLEHSYDRRNHTEAVEKLSCMFRSEINGFYLAGTRGKGGAREMVA
jgi:hypothetical protein